MYGFVFAVLFLILFAGFTSMVPVDLQGQGSNPDIVIPVDPSLFTDWTAYEDYQKSDMTLLGNYYFLYYNALGSYDWRVGHTTTTEEFDLAAKIYYGGFLWLGGLDSVEFISMNGTNHGTSVSLTDIDNDLEEGASKYNLIFSISGNDAGDFIFYYNTTTYASASSAWTNNGLFLVHGVGFTANTDIVSLLFGILFLQLPDVPIGINLLLASAPWASVIYILWFLVTKSLPLLG